MYCKWQNHSFCWIFNLLKEFFRNTVQLYRMAPYGCALDLVGLKAKCSYWSSSLVMVVNYLSILCLDPRSLDSLSAFLLSLNLHSSACFHISSQFIIYPAFRIVRYVWYTWNIKICWGAGQFEISSRILGSQAQGAEPFPCMLKRKRI